MTKLYGGIDLHAKNRSLVIVDEEDQIMFEKRIPNDLEKILFYLSPLSTYDPRSCGGIHVQLVLVSRWAYGCWLLGQIGQHGSHPTITYYTFIKYAKLWDMTRARAKTEEPSKRGKR